MNNLRAQQTRHLILILFSSGCATNEGDLLLWQHEIQNLQRWISRVLNQAPDVCYCSSGARRCNLRFEHLRNNWPIPSTASQARKTWMTWIPPRDLLLPLNCVYSFSPGPLCRVFSFRLHPQKVIDLTLLRPPHLTCLHSSFFLWSF